MIRYPKRLIEVDLPIKRISEHARAERNSRLAHIPRLHIYPAARPLAACRAVICASLWPDPADESCPSSFLTSARDLMRAWADRHLSNVSSDSYPRFNSIQKSPKILDDKLELRNALLDFIADFSAWENSTSTASSRDQQRPDAQRTSCARSLCNSEAISSRPVRWRRRDGIGSNKGWS